MKELGNVSSIAHAIQMAVAPVFLLTAVGTLLSVMANRLGRVIDRARALEIKLETIQPEKELAAKDLLKILSRRARLINYAITACTIAALLVCAVIAILFFGSYANLEHSRETVSLLFILAMLSLMTGLLCFLQEVFLATLNLRIGVK